MYHRPKTKPRSAVETRQVSISAGCTVVELRPSKKQRGVYVALLDDDNAFLCTDDVVARWGVRPGAQFDAEATSRLMAEAELSLATRIALELVSLGPRTRQQLVKTLLRRGITSSAAAKAADRLTELGYIDDLVYAQALVSQLERRGDMGRLRMRLELLKRGIEPSLAESVLRRYDVEEERQRALLLTRKRAQAYALVEPLVMARRVSSYLQRRGFDWDTIRWCLSRVVPEVDREQ